MQRISWIAHFFSLLMINGCCVFHILETHKHTHTVILAVVIKGVNKTCINPSSLHLNSSPPVSLLVFYPLIVPFSFISSPLFSPFIPFDHLPCILHSPSPFRVVLIVLCLFFSSSTIPNYFASFHLFFTLPLLSLSVLP